MNLTLVTTVAAATAGLVHAAPPAAAAPFPAEFALPPAFAPEGIAIGRGTTVYVGSIPTGDIWRGDLRTGDGDVFHHGASGTAAIGLAVDDLERVFVAGGRTGQARVVDGRTGDLLATYQLTTAATFVNDVVVAGGSAWFTDSVNPVLYRVPLDLGPAETVPISGDLTYASGFNVNGIDATPDGGTLVLVQSNEAALFTADPATGVTRRIELRDETGTGPSVPNGDGILLDGRTLYVVQNRASLVAVVELAPDLSAGTITARLGAARFDVPTTIDRFGDTLYAVNARFGTAVEDDTPYWVTALDR